MSNRDWEKELAMIDRQLASLSDEELAAHKEGAPAQGSAAGRPGVAPAARAQGAPALSGVAPAAPTAAAAPVPGTGWRARLAVNGKLLVALAAGVGILFWPWGWRCGSELAVFMAAVAGVTMSGVWAARSTWYHRAGKRHVLALLVVLWGLALAAWQVLPRAGLVVPKYMNVPAVWGCG